MDDESGIHLSIAHSLEDPVERDELELEGREKEAQGQSGGGEHSRDRDGPPGESLDLHGLPGHDARSVAFPQARPAWEHGIALGEVGIGVDGGGAQLQLGPQAPLIQALDVLKLLDDLQVLGVDEPFGQRIEHEGVVGIRRMGDGDAPGLRLHARAFWIDRVWSDETILAAPDEGVNGGGGRCYDVCLR